MLYYKLLIDKHDKSLINMLDLSSMLNAETGKSKANNQFVKFEHTKFSESNKKAMAMLIILLERKNMILKFLQNISELRNQILTAQK